jgi:hypothetical protein
MRRGINFRGMKSLFLLLEQKTQIGARGGEQKCVKTHKSSGSRQEIFELKFFSSLSSIESR